MGLDNVLYPSCTRACQYLEQHILEHNLCFIPRISHRMNQRATNSGSKIVQLFNLIKLQPLVTTETDTADCDHRRSGHTSHKI